MTDVLPLLALPALLGWWTWARVAAPPLRRELHRLLAGEAPLPLLDAGRAPLAAVAQSLRLAAHAQLPPPQTRRPRRESDAIVWDLAATVAPRGLAIEQVIERRRDRLGRTRGYRGATLLTGVRHGRHVIVELADTTTTISIAAPCPRLTVAASPAGELRASVDDGPVATALGMLSASWRWAGVDVVADGTWVVLQRGTPATSWMHDLWLAEFVADVAMLDAPDETPGIGVPARAR